MVDREHPSLSLVRQCALLGVSRSSLYYRPRAASAENLSLMGEIDRQYLETPFFGSRRMEDWLERRGMRVSRKRVQRLMRAMGRRAIYRRLGTSRRSPEHPVYPYLLRNARITRPNQSLPPRRRGCGQPTSPTCPWPGASSTWWRSWTGTAGTCWLGGYRTPWKPTFASMRCRRRWSRTGPRCSTPTRACPCEGRGQPVHQRGVHPGASGPWGADQHGREGAVLGQHLRGAAVAHGEVRGGVPEAYANATDVRRELDAYFRFYNDLRPHQALGYRTPAEVFHGTTNVPGEKPRVKEGAPERALVSLAGTAGLSLNSASILSR